MSECPDCNCSDFDKCLRILNLILDNEADAEQQAYFYKHIEDCIICFSHYNLEKQIRQLVKNKVKPQHIPQDLIDDIRSKIVS